MMLLPYVRPLLLLATGLSLTLPLQAQVTAGSTNGPTAVDAAAKLNTLLADAEALQRRKRFIDAFAKLDEAESIDPKRGEIYAIRAAIYMSLPARDQKDLDQAREQLAKAIALKPGDLAITFSQAELEFISGKWPETESTLNALLAQFPKLPATLRHLVQFKVIIAMAKQGKVEAAERLLTSNFSFMDDTPAYYFSKAVIALQKQDEKTGKEWQLKARLIFKPGDTDAYFDSLMESHYIDSLSVPKADETTEPAKP